MNYSETIEYLYSTLPMFTRMGNKAYKADITNIRTLCEVIGNPQQKFKSIHIGGTNGKGSTSHMLAAILQIAGYKTGLYTSPHLRDFRERIRINGEMISENKVVSFIEQNKSVLEQVKPSFFETTVAMAFEHFAKEEVDIAVIEVGLGGRLDSTNIINPLLSIITNIGFDHVDILGNTLKKIATEKAGIIKPKTPVIIGQKQTETTEVFNQVAQLMESKIVFASEGYHIQKIQSQYPQQLHIESINLNTLATNDIHLDLTGSYQLKNVTTVLTAVDELREQGFDISETDVQTALKQITKLTGLMGRWQTLSTEPLVICDTGHNEDGVQEVLKNIHNTAHNKLHMVIGMVGDKDSDAILTLLPKGAEYYFCQPNLPRAKPVTELAQEAQSKGLQGKSFLSVNEALQAAKESAQGDDLIFVGGSTFVVAEVV